MVIFWSCGRPTRDLPVQGVVAVFDSTDNGTIAVAPTSGSVLGGTVLRIQGSGRFRQSSRYRCVFGLDQSGSGQQQQNATSEANYVSADEVVCVTPAVTPLLLGASMKTGAALSSGNFFLCVDDVEFYPAAFTFYSDDVQIQTVAPSVITSSGGLVRVTLNDSAVKTLLSGGLHFSCVVQGIVIPAVALPLDTNTTVPPILWGPSEGNGIDDLYTLICPVPPYDFTFEPPLLDNYTKSGVELSVGVTINGVDMFYSVTPLTVVPTPTIGSLAPPVAMLRDGDALGSVSGPLVTIYGLGFTNTTSLACMVGSGGDDSSDKMASKTITTAVYINTTAVQCILNYTLPGPQLVQFSVNGVHWVPVGIFEYIAAPVLVAIAPSEGPDHGNTVVRIQMAGTAIGGGGTAIGSGIGSGGGRSSALGCEFLREGVSLQLAPAWVDNNNDVLCTTKAMSPGIIQVYLNYYGQRSDSYVNFTSYPTESMVALFPTNVQAGKNLTIDGKS